MMTIPTYVPFNEAADDHPRKLLAPRSQWGEETGPSMRPRMIIRGNEAWDAFSL